MSLQLSPPKPFKSYPELVELLVQRGMVVDDRAWAEKKIAQIGYYRLSGFWYPCKQITIASDGRVVLSQVTGKPERLSHFIQGTSFSSVIQLYLFDKQLRQLMLDAIERIEIGIRAIIAHELGYHDPLAYLNADFINPKHVRPFTDKHSGRPRHIWHEWLEKQDRKIKESREDCIQWHIRSRKAMPFWVAIEAWDFGTMSKYFEILKGDYQNRIASRLAISNAKTLVVWLKELNTLRNRAAHHIRIWNQRANNPLSVINNDYFEGLNLSAEARSRLYGNIAVLWYLVKAIGANSGWINQVADVIDTKPDVPGCSYAAMGFPDERGFPRVEFGILSMSAMMFEAGPRPRSRGTLFARHSM